MIYIRNLELSAANYILVSCVLFSTLLQVLLKQNYPALLKNAIDITKPKTFSL